MFLRNQLTTRVLLLCASTALFSGCATTQAPTEDPLEDFNRGIDAVNDTLDRNIMAPIADTYVENTSDGFRESITNFYDNLAYPGVFLNDLLQGKLVDAGTDAARFVVNSTAGMAGFLDPATAWGLDAHDEDFGQTLGAWGMDEGAYLVVPFYGPSSIRDSTDLVVSQFTNVLYFASLSTAVSIPLTALDIVNSRANLSSAIRLRDASALDPYVFTREAYRQKRANLIHDGNLPDEEFEIDDDEAALDDPFAEDPYATTGTALN